jgi:hypothetical protein
LLHHSICCQGLPLQQNELTTPQPAGCLASSPLVPGGSDWALVRALELDTASPPSLSSRFGKQRVAESMPSSSIIVSRHLHFLFDFPLFFRAPTLQLPYRRVSMAAHTTSKCLLRSKSFQLPCRRVSATTLFSRTVYNPLFPILTTPYDT